MKQKLTLFHPILSHEAIRQDLPLNRATDMRRTGAESRKKWEVTFHRDSPMAEYLRLALTLFGNYGRMACSSLARFAMSVIFRILQIFANSLIALPVLA